MVGQKIIGLQYLRGIAALMVVVNHTDGQIRQVFQFFPFEMWACGVDIFFVISGFIIYTLSYNLRSRVDKYRFIIGRLLRVVPLYWIFTTVMALVLVVMPNVFRTAQFSAYHYVLSLLFIPHLNIAMTHSPILAIGWTLNYEMMFYVLFFIAMQINFDYRAVITSFILISFVIIQQIYGFSGPFSFYSNSIVCEFIYGIVIAEIYHKGKLNISVNSGIALSIFGFGSYIAFAWSVGSVDIFEIISRSIIWGIPAACIVSSFLVLNDNYLKSRNIFSFTGDASYSIYLVHLFLIGVCRTIWPIIAARFTGVIGGIAFDAFTVAVAWIAGGAVYVALERPIMHLTRGAMRLLFASPNLASAPIALDRSNA